ncbi:hypothetical protein [Chryseobacterium defluvii]|uniref:Uncharacterized protein n=1 Tax=Chryseobacterium defluvii TaxID=160396 RepID=A0A495SQK4_9FLAO|nr:hypothetical protein [Chryseobacterium defluvii]RKT01782.1 hypothetical protein BCF58_1007 [Chryseobacterium defluvii]
MARGSNIYLFLAIVSIIITWLFVGLFRDDEFYKPSLFLKHQPTFKTIFCSPIGMSDLHFESLPNNERTEEIAFQEYVVKQNIQKKNGVELFFVPLILIQTTLTLLSFGIMGTWGKFVYEKRHFITHFSLCFIAIFMGNLFIMSFDKILLTRSYWDINIWIKYRFFTKKNKNNKILIGGINRRRLIQRINKRPYLLKQPILLDSAVF